MKKRILLTILGAVLLLAATVCATAKTPDDYNSVSQAVLDFTGETPVCPYCGTAPAEGWTALDKDITQWQRLDGHYYLAGDRTNSSYYGVVGGNACVYLGDYNITAANEYAFQVEGGTMTLIGRGEVTGNHNVSNTVGGTIDVVAGTLNLCGGTYKKGIVNGCAVVTQRNAASTVNMYEGTVICEGNAETESGGNVRIGDGSAFHMYGGEIRDGVAQRGGNVAVTGENALLRMYGGVVSGGKAQLPNGADNDGENYGLGGNIYVAQGSFRQDKGAAISNGAAFTGGNIYYASAETATLAGTVIGGTGKTAGSIDLRGGKLILAEGAVVSGGNASYDGGNIQVYLAILEVSGGNITGGKAGRWGGNIVADGGNTQVVITAGKISGGESTGNHGGNLCVDNGAQLRLSGGTVTGGRAMNATEGRGGNLYIGNADVQLENVVISMGEAYIAGGNIHIQEYEKDIVVKGCRIDHGTAAAGGNIYTYKTNLQIAGDTVLTEGSSQWPKDASFAGGGGNLFCQEGEVWIYGQVKDGSANLTGGNLEVRDAELYIANGATVSGGSAGYDGGNISVNDHGILILTGSTVSGGTAGRYGSNIYSTGSVVLEATAVAKDCGGVYLGANGGLRVYGSFDGDVAVSGLELPDPLYGATMPETRFTSVGSFAGKVWLTQVQDNPCLFGEDGKLFVSAVYTCKDGVKTWYQDNAAAVANYDQADYLVPDGDLILAGETYTVDLAGQDLQITGTGRLTCFDSSNDTYKTWGSARIKGPVLKNELAQLIEGKYYVRSKANGAYSFHRFDLRISDVSLRVANGGLYYSARWQCDDTLLELIQGFGIGVSVKDMPTERLRYDDDTLHTYHSPNEFVSGVKTNGVLVCDILRAVEAADAERVEKNSEYGKMPIYAKAFVILDNGVDRQQTVISNDNIAMSLHDVLTSIDGQMPLYYSQAKTLQEFRDFWAQNGLTGKDWEFAFSVPEAIWNLQQEYEEDQPLTGQFQDQLEGTADLQVWKTKMNTAGLAFVSCLEKGKVSYITGENWDDTAFVGGIETNLTVDGQSLDVNLLFASFRDLDAVLAESTAFNYSAGTVTTNPLDRSGLVALHEKVLEHNGLMLLAHPKQEGLIDSRDALDYWFADGMAVDVFSGSSFKQNYKLWTDLLAEGKRVWAASSNAGALQGKGDTVTLYAAENRAKAYMERLAMGDYTCGPLGIQMMVGNTCMGSSGTFAGNMLAFRVDQAVTGVLQRGHTYRIDLISKEGVLQSWPYTGREVYQMVAADENQAFYRLEVVDETTGQIISLSNPIWNDGYGLQVGFAREDITPDYTVLITGGKRRASKGVKDNDGIFLTCVALKEGKETYLIYTADLISASSSYYTTAFKHAVAEATGVPVSHIRFSTTHTHSSVGVTSSDWTDVLGENGNQARQRFLTELNAAGIRTAQAAMADAAAVDTAYAGAVTGKNDVAFVRHYVKRNGTLDYSNEGGYDSASSIFNATYKAHATVADQDIQLVKFQRDGKKDVLMMSVPAHATLNENSEYLSADFPLYARRYIESNTNALVACFIGAAGDQVPRSKLSNYYLRQSLGVTANNTDAAAYGEKLGGYVVEKLNAGLTPLRSTVLKHTTATYVGQVGTINFEKIDIAKSLMEKYEAGQDITSALKSAGFVSYDDLRFTIYRWDRVQKYGSDMTMYVNTMAIGDLGFVFAPYEMAGVNGTQLKADSPYATTFIATCTDDSVSYVASQGAFDHSSYEAQCTWFASGSGELLVRRFVGILEQQKYNQ